MSKAKTVDLTSGPILKTLAELALPIMISSMLGTAYSIMDMAWIGLLGAKAVAGVGVGGMYVWLSQGLASLSRMGGQVNTAQACGRKDYDQARSYAAGSLQLTALSGILFAAVCVIFIQPLLGFFNLTDAETYTAAKSYTLITCGLILFSYLNLTLTGLSTAQGDSRTPLLANFIGLAGNMILDPLLILGIGPFPRLEVAGAAIATVSSQIQIRKKDQSTGDQCIRSGSSISFCVGQIKKSQQRLYEKDRKSTRLNSSHLEQSRMPSSA